SARWLIRRGLDRPRLLPAAPFRTPPPARKCHFECPTRPAPASVASRSPSTSLIERRRTGCCGLFRNEANAPATRLAPTTTASVNARRFFKSGENNLEAVIPVVGLHLRAGDGPRFAAGPRERQDEPLVHVRHEMLNQRGEAIAAKL